MQWFIIATNARQIPSTGFVQNMSLPLLKNGDGLKPGDWIMVRTEGLCGWKKRKFMCYAEGRFFVLDYGESFKECATYSRWKQARLPKEDE